MRLTEIGDLARDLAALAPAMRNTIEPLARSSRGAASGVGSLNDELEDNKKHTSAAKDAVSKLSAAMLTAMRNSIAWNDEQQRQLRGGMSAASRSISVYKERTQALDREAKAIAALSGTSIEGASKVASGMDAAFQALGKDMMNSSDLIHNVGSGLFMDIFKDVSKVRQQLNQDATKLRNDALVSQRISGMSDASTAAMFKTALVDMQLDPKGASGVFDEIAKASRDFGLAGEASFQVLTGNMEDIRRQDVKDRESYARRLLTTAGLMERAGLDFKKYAGNLLVGHGAKGLQDTAMAAAVLGTDQTHVFNLQSRSRANDLGASKELADLVETMLKQQAPRFSLEDYQKQQRGDLRVNNEGQLNAIMESQELASQWLKLIGMDIDTFASLRDASSRIDMVNRKPGSNESAIAPHLKNEAATNAFFDSTRTMGEAVNQYGAMIAQFFDGMTKRIADMGQAVGLGTTESGMRDVMRTVGGINGATGGVLGGLAGGAAGMFGLSKLLQSGGGLSRLLPGLLGGGGAASASGAAAGGGLLRLGAGRIPLIGYALGGLSTAMQSDKEKDMDLKEAQGQGAFRRALSGIINPIGQAILLKRSLSQASETASALKDADLRFARAQQLESEVKRVMAESATITQKVKQHSPSRTSAEAKAQKTAVADGNARSETILSRILDSIQQTNSLLADFVSASQLGSVQV